MKTQNHIRFPAATLYYYFINYILLHCSMFQLIQNPFWNVFFLVVNFCCTHQHMNTTYHRQKGHTQIHLTHDRKQAARWLLIACFIRIFISFGLITSQKYLNKSQYSYIILYCCCARFFLAAFFWYAYRMQCSFRLRSKFNQQAMWKKKNFSEFGFVFEWKYPVKRMKKNKKHKYTKNGSKIAFFFISRIRYSHINFI